MNIGNLDRNLILMNYLKLDMNKGNLDKNY